MSNVDPGLHYPIDLKELPRNWDVCYVGDRITDIQPGFASGVHNQEGRGVAHLRPMNVDRQGRIDLSVVKSVPDKGGPRLREGDVLFNNTNSAELIGKTAAITGSEDWAFSNHMTRLRPPATIYGKFVAHQLHFIWMSGYFRHRCVKHVNQASISSGTLARSVPLVLPPLPEQCRIVAEIEKQFTRLEVGVAALRRVQANLKRYRAAVLKAACEGRLVPTEGELARTENRNLSFETGKALLSRILVERKLKWEKDQLLRFRGSDRAPKNDKWRSRYQEPSTPNASELPPLPAGWTWAELGQVTWSVKDGPHYSPNYVTEGIPFISGGNIRPSGVDFSNAKRISPELHAELSQRCKPEVGDILYTKGGTTGIARVNTYSEEFNVWVHVAVLKLVESVDRFFIQHTLNSPACYAQAQNMTHGVGNQDLGLTRMIHISFGLPPLAEQIRIVAELEKRLSVIEELETAVGAKLKHAGRLRQSILQQSFAGQLLTKGTI